MNPPFFLLDVNTLRHSDHGIIARIAAFTHYAILRSVYPNELFEMANCEKMYKRAS